MNTEILEIIKNLNLKLHKEFCKNNDDEIYTPTILRFLNNLDGLFVKFFSSIEEINTFLVNIEDMGNFIDFYNAQDGYIEWSLLVKHDGNISFIAPGGFYDFVNDILMTLDDEEVISFNKYIMSRLY